MSPRQVFKHQGPAVVLIMATDPDLDTTSNGTGSIIRADGLVLTNAHVILNKAAQRPFKEIAIFLKPDKLSGDSGQDLSRQYEAELLSHDAALDLALLKIRKPPKGLAVISLGECSDVSPGDQAIAIGHPEQGGLWTLTTGAISSQMADQGGVPGKDVFQVEASINRGNSGGPLLDDRGYLIGVNSSIARKAADGLAITGINFALKSSVAKRYLDAHKVSLAYGPLDHDDAAIAKAYGYAPVAAAVEAPAPTAIPTAAPTAAPTPVPTLIPTALPTAAPRAAATALPTAVPTLLPTPLPTPVPTAVPRPERKPRTFKMDLAQKPRPYKPQELSAHLKALLAKRDKAVDELDKALEGETAP